MTPVYISGCFGVLHPAHGRRGVLLLGTLGDEAMNAYRPLVFLAEQFAAAGCPTLRLEYYGFGDSGGEDDEPDRVQRWLDSIAVGIRWLRETCGAETVTLVGVRIGAVLAARAACEADAVDALVLVSPVTSGRRFLRELVLAAHTNAEIWQVDPRTEDASWFEAHGLRLDRAARDALERMDISKLPSCPARRTLVVDSPDSASAHSLIERLQRSGTEVTHLPAAGLAAILRDAHENEVPHEAFARVVAWHAALDSTAHTAPAMVRLTKEDRLGTPVLTVAAGVERPVWFGPQNALFGIVCEPAQPLPDAPVVLIANTGANPRYGNSRAAVLVARWLASHGVASLRMDGAGIGDSRPETGERGQPYSAQSDADLRAGLDALSARFTGPLIVLGMCSGAYHALHGAYQDRRVRGLMLVNLQKFVWQTGQSLSVLQRTTVRTTRFYMNNIASASTMQRLLRGDINVAGITKALAGRAGRRVAAACDPAFQVVRRKETPVGRIRRQTRDLLARSVQVLFVLSGNDPGLDELAEYFGSEGRQLRRLPNVTFHLMDGADHTLSAYWARQALLQQIAIFLNRCFHVPVAPKTVPDRAVVRAAAPAMDGSGAVGLAIGFGNETVAVAAGDGGQAR